MATMITEQQHNSKGTPCKLCEITDTEVEWAVCLSWFTNLWACAGFYFCISEVFIRFNKKKMSSEYPNFKIVFIMHSNALSRELGLIL